MERWAVDDAIYNLIHSYRAVCHRFSSALQEVCQPYAVSVLEGLTLYLLKRHQAGLVMNEIAQSLTVANSTATVLIDRLVEQNLVERELIHQDRRHIRCVLTGKGEAVADAIWGVGSTFIHQLQDQLQLSDAEQAFVLALNTRIQANLRNSGGI